MGVHIPVRKRVIGSASLLHKPVWGDVERTYAQKVLALGPIAYWPLWETSGTTAECLVNPAQNGTYNSDVSTWPPGTGIGDGNTAPGFDGANDYVQVYTATLAAAFNGSEGTASVWVRVANAGVWTDAATHQALTLRVDANNMILLRKFATNNRIVNSYIAGGVTKQLDTFAFGGTLTWMHWAITWSKSVDEFRPYINGAQQGATLNGLGNWAGVLANNESVIGSYVAVPNALWQGWLVHCAVWDRALPPGDILELATV